MILLRFLLLVPFSGIKVIQQYLLKLKVHALQPSNSATHYPL